jgi:hypothetical protein
MSKSTKEILDIKTRLLTDGLAIFVEGKQFSTKYLKRIWQQTPDKLKQVLLENLAYAETHWLPLILNKEKIVYNTNQPLFEPLFFKNQLYDLLFCEEVDEVRQLTYLKQFYNLEFSFKETTATLPAGTEFSWKKKRQPIAIVPFTFGKESLVTLALCLELGIKPILVYCQEPSQPYEEKYKLQKLAEISKKYKVPYYFIKHQPGLFRYGKAFNLKFRSEIGWGTQVTLLTLLVMPFVYHFQADYILYGNENSNNEKELANGWKVYSSADQTGQITGAQNNLVQILSNGHCQLKSTLEPLEEINIFHLLIHRYPDLSRYLFSCFAETPLYRGSQWCNHCYKCTRLYLFTKALGVNPAKIGFKKDLLQSAGDWRNYFGSAVRTGSTDELDFAFYLLYRKNDQSPCVKLFKEKKLPHLKSWSWYAGYFSQLKAKDNLPKAYQKKLLTIFNQDLTSFKKLL